MQSKAALPCNVQEHPPLSAAVDVAAAAAAAAATIVCAYLCPLCCSGVTLTLALGVPGCCRQQAQVDEAARVYSCSYNYSSWVGLNSLTSLWEPNEAHGAGYAHHNRCWGFFRPGSKMKLIQYATGGAGRCGNKCTYHSVSLVC